MNLGFSLIVNPHNISILYELGFTQACRQTPLLNSAFVSELRIKYFIETDKLSLTLRWLFCFSYALFLIL